jgi:hypothetical protein
MTRAFDDIDGRRFLVDSVLKTESDNVPSFRGSDLLVAAELISFSAGAAVDGRACVFVVGVGTGAGVG